MKIFLTINMAVFFTMILTGLGVLVGTVIIVSTCLVVRDRSVI